MPKSIDRKLTLEECVTAEHLRGSVFCGFLPDNEREHWSEILTAFASLGPREVTTPKYFFEEMSEATCRYIERVDRITGFFDYLLRFKDTNSQLDGRFVQDKRGYLRDFDYYVCNNETMRTPNDREEEFRANTQIFPPFYTAAHEALSVLKRYSRALQRLPVDDDVLVALFWSVSEACFKAIDAVGGYESEALLFSEYYRAAMHAQTVIESIDLSLPLSITIGKIGVFDREWEASPIHTLLKHVDFDGCSYSPFPDDQHMEEYPRIDELEIERLEFLLDEIDSLLRVHGRQPAEIFQAARELETERRAKGRSAKRSSSRGGRPRLSSMQETRYLRLAEEWNDSVGRRSKDEFCRDQNINRNTLDRALDWKRKRDQRDSWK